MKRPAYTLILLKSDQLARADFSAGSPPKLLNFWREPRGIQGETDDYVRSALALGGGPCGRNVWVLCEDLWTQALSFPAAKFVGLEDAQLVRAFAFEAEPLSGIGGMDAVAGHVPIGAVGGTYSFWVTLTDAYTRDRIQAVVQQAGGKLNGLCHPAGVPSRLEAGSGNEAWSRVEVWRQITLCLAGRGGAVERTEIVNAGSTQARAQASVDAWMAGQNVQRVEVLEAHEKAQLQVNAGAGEFRLALSDETAMRAWFEAWIRVLDGAPKSVPLILPVPPEVPKFLYAGVGILAEALVLGVCFWHYFAIDALKQESLSRAHEYGHKTQFVSDLKKKSEDANREAEKLKLANDLAEKTTAELEKDFGRMRSRILLLLKSVAEKRPVDTMVETIKTDSSGGLQLVGTTLEASYADQMAMDLSAALAHAGWSVRPLQKEGGKLLANGGPWKFTLGVCEPNAVKSQSAVNAEVVPVRRR
jgi:hypothetical protein